MTLALAWSIIYSWCAHNDALLKLFIIHNTIMHTNTQWACTSRDRAETHRDRVERWPELTRIALLMPLLRYWTYWPSGYSVMHGCVDGKTMYCIVCRFIVVGTAAAAIRSFKPFNSNSFPLCHRFRVCVCGVCTFDEMLCGSSNCLEIWTWAWPINIFTFIWIDDTAELYDKTNRCSISSWKALKCRKDSVSCAPFI